MTMKTLKGIKITPAAKKRLKTAEENYKKILQEIMPYIKKRKFKSYSTYGKWVSSRIEGA
ncbi:MAG: hypothetical protein AB1424_08320 [Thermodesulfobacteriota bacterium]